ncbi:MAG: antitoxin Xre-like helix-turn-helix domain-containing protein [Steroidobacterales bacterium]
MRAEPHIRRRMAEESGSRGSLHLRVGELLGLKVAVTSEVDLIDCLEKGLPIGSVQALRTRVGLTDEEVYALIAPRRTLNRREAEHQVLSRDEADRAIRVARIAARAQHVFSAKPTYALEWLRTAQRTLGDRTPIQVLGSDAGARAAEELLVGIEHGLFG